MVSHKVLLTKLWTLDFSDLALNCLDHFSLDFVETEAQYLNGITYIIWHDSGGERNEERNSSDSSWFVLCLWYG